MPTVTLSHDECVSIGAAVASFLTARDWNFPRTECNFRAVTLSDESVQAIADELAARLV